MTSQTLNSLIPEDFFGLLKEVISMNCETINSAISTDETETPAVKGVILDGTDKKKVTQFTVDTTAGTGHNFLLISKKSGEYNLVRNRLASKCPNIIIEFPTNQDKPTETRDIITAYIKKFISDATDKMITEYKATSEYSALSSLKKANAIKAMRTEHGPVRMISTKISLLNMNAEDFENTMKEFRDKMANNTIPSTLMPKTTKRAANTAVKSKPKKAKKAAKESKVPDTEETPASTKEANNESVEDDDEIIFMTDIPKSMPDKAIIIKPEHKDSFHCAEDDSDKEDDVNVVA